jgi:hypothetical protein
MLQAIFVVGGDNHPHRVRNGPRCNEAPRGFMCSLALIQVKASKVGQRHPTYFTSIIKLIGRAEEGELIMDALTVQPLHPYAHDGGPSKHSKLC